MHSNTLVSTFTMLALSSVLACASATSPQDEGSSDEDFTAAQDPREPDRAAVLQALKSTNRTSFMPATVAFVSEASTHNVVALGASMAGNIPAGTIANGDLLNQVSADLRKKKFAIAGKYASFDRSTCQFKSKGDYLGLSTQTTLLADNMAAGNAALAPTVAYTAEMLAAARNIDKQVKYKLTMTSQRVSLYLGKSGSQWKILAIDTTEFACLGDSP